MSDSDDDFALFDSDDDEQPPPSTKPAPLIKASSSVTLDTLRAQTTASIAATLPATLEDLVLQQGGEEIVSELTAAFDAFDTGAEQEAAEPAERVVRTTWNALQAGKSWPHQSWCEAHIFCRMLLCFVELCKGRFGKSIEHADLAMILGAPPEAVYDLVAFAEARMNPEVAPIAEATEGISECCLEIERPMDGYPTSGTQVCRKGVLSVAQFNSECFSPREPTVLEGMINHWAALDKWRDLQWLVQTVGHRTVPVEVGRHHGEHWTECTMTIGDFVAKYLEPDLQVSAGGKANMSEDYKVAYIAQHALFDQLPALRKDFRTPPLCNLGPKGLQRVNAWIGSSGTVTPLHFDSYDNLLCQVLGFKYVRLYSQSENAYLYLDKQMMCHMLRRISAL